MQIDRELVNRALNKAGQTALTEDDITNNAEMWKTCKAFYLQTILETLTRTPWTSAKKRAMLVEPDNVENLSTFYHMYPLPIDCARALKLNSGEDYIIEGTWLYTNDSRPVLMYITNGKLEPTVDEPIEDEPIEEEQPEEPTEEDGVVNESLTTEPTEEESTEEEPEEDIPGYATLEYDPNFWEYIETRLASKIVLKITGETQLYNLLFGEAQIIEQTAAKASKAAGKSKPRGQTFWTDEIVGRL